MFYLQLDVLSTIIRVIYKYTCY